MAQKTVIDASVAVKWFLTEAGSAEARGLRDAHKLGDVLLIAPEFILAETLNTLRYKGRELRLALETLTSEQMHLVRFDTRLLASACELALEHDLSIYDSLYVAVANRYGAELITADTDFKDVPGARMLEI